MIYAMHIPKRERKRALRDVYAMEPVALKFNPWSSCPITFDRTLVRLCQTLDTPDKPANHTIRDCWVFK